MKTFPFTAIIEREGLLSSPPSSGFIALCPELDIASQGETVEEARQNLEEAVEFFLNMHLRKKYGSASIKKST